MHLACGQQEEWHEILMGGLLVHWWTRKLISNGIALLIKNLVERGWSVITSAEGKVKKEVI